MQGNVWFVLVGSVACGISYVLPIHRISSIQTLAANL